MAFYIKTCTVYCCYYVYYGLPPWIYQIQEKNLSPISDINKYILLFKICTIRYTVRILTYTQPLKFWIFVESYWSVCVMFNILYIPDLESPSKQLSLWTEPEGEATVGLEPSSYFKPSIMVSIFPENFSGYFFSDQFPSIELGEAAIIDFDTFNYLHNWLGEEEGRAG